MQQYSAAEWGEIFDEAGLIWGPVQSVVDVVDDPQARAMGMFTEIDHPDREGTVETVASPIRIQGADIGPKGPAPHLGADTDDVLAEAGYSPEEIAELRSAGSVGPAD